MSQKRQISVHRIAGSLGAEIQDVDLIELSKDSGLVKKIHEAFLEHQVIFFRNQQFEPQDYLDFTAQFGKPIEYPFVKGIDGYPEIIQVLKEVGSYLILVVATGYIASLNRRIGIFSSENAADLTARGFQKHETINFGGIWHSDTSYFQEPPMGSILWAREVPPYGGDTLFANQYAAYEALSDGLKQTLSSLKAVNTSAKADASKTREDRIKDSGNKDAKSLLEATHPVIRTHPDTGRKALYVNVAHTSRFQGWTEAESAPLLNFLFQHQVKPEFTCRFRWDVGSIAFWDNRCVQHNPINDYHGHRRSMLRVTLQGNKPV